VKNIKLLLITLTLLSASAFTLIKSIDWKVNNDYSVKGEGCVFKGLTARILFDEEHPEKSTISASIDARTVNSGNGAKNAHVKEKEALDTEKYPLIFFVSRSVKKIDENGRYEVTGNLTLKGITKEIKFPFSFDSKKNLIDRFPMVPKETFCGKMSIVSKDFNITREGAPITVFVDLTIPVTQ